MPDIPSNIVKINDIEVQGEAPHSEALWTKTGATLNGVVDSDALQNSRLTTVEGKVLVLESIDVSTPISLTTSLTTTSGRVHLSLQPGSVSNGSITHNGSGLITLSRGGSIIARWSNHGTAGSFGTVSFVDLSAAIGANTYVFAATTGFSISFMYIAAFEIK